MNLSTQNRNTLLTDLHRIIEEQTRVTVQKIFEHPMEDRSIYPPDSSKSPQEHQALADLQHNPDLQSALTKVFEDNTATVLFRFFSIIDQVAEPDAHSGNWSPVILVDQPEDYNEPIEYLHDHFFETYWDWKEQYQQNPDPVN